MILLGDLNNFYVSSTTLRLSGALLLEARSSALRYDCTARHVTRGIDHFQLVMYLGGGAEFVSSDRTFRQRVGDVSLIDMARPSLTREMQADDGATSVVSFVFPRLLLRRCERADSGSMIRIIRRETPYAAMLRDYMLSLRRRALELTHGESQIGRPGAGGAVAGGCRPRGKMTGRRPARRGKHCAPASRLISRAISGCRRSGSSLCHEFALSRTGLYRLFAPKSPMSYIQQRRLHRAFAMLFRPFPQLAHS